MEVLAEVAWPGLRGKGVYNLKDLLCNLSIAVDSNGVGTPSRPRCWVLCKSAEAESTDSEYEH